MGKVDLHHCLFLQVVMLNKQKIRKQSGHTNTSVFTNVPLMFSEAYHLYWCVRAFSNSAAAGNF